jgi:hypothetical protein
MKVIFFTVRDDPSHYLVHSHYPLVDDLYGHCIPFLLPPLLTLFLVATWLVITSNVAADPRPGMLRCIHL